MKHLRNIFMLVSLVTFMESCEPQSLEQEIEMEEIENKQLTTDEDTSDVNNEKDG